MLSHLILFQLSITDCLRGIDFPPEIQQRLLRENEGASQSGFVCAHHKIRCCTIWGWSGPLASRVLPLDFPHTCTLSQLEEESLHKETFKFVLFPPSLHPVILCYSVTNSFPSPSRPQLWWREKVCAGHPRCVLLLPITGSTRTFAEGTGTHLNSKVILRRKREGGRRLQKSF